MEVYNRSPELCQHILGLKFSKMYYRGIWLVVKFSYPSYMLSKFDPPSFNGRNVDPIVAKA